MRGERGFTLIEMMIVVAIIALIAAIAIPNLRRARQAANAASAKQSLRTITTAQYMYERKYGVYGTLAQLAPEGTLDSVLQTGTKSNYVFALTATATSFSCTATPLEDPTRLEHFYVDQTSVIRFSQGSPADSTSPPIPK